MKIFYVNEIKKLLIIISCLGLLIFSCDEREPEDPNTVNYVISVESQPVAGGINGDIVGEDGLLGDVNGDGVLNVLDVVTLVNIILNDNDYILAGDMNQDGALDVLDIVTLVNIILN